MLTNTILCLGSFLALWDHANAASNYGPGLYAFTGNTSLFKYNPSNGSAIEIETAQNNEYLADGVNEGCLDNVHNIYFFLYCEFFPQTNETKLGMYPYDLSDTTKVYSPIILTDFFADGIGDAGDACIGDPNTGDIIVFGHSKYNRFQQLLARISFDPSTDTADVKIIGNISKVDDEPLIPGTLAAYDTKRDTVWFVGTYKNHVWNQIEIYLYNFDAKTGKILKEINYLYNTIYVAAYYEKMDQLVGVNFIGIDDTENKYDMFQVVYLDPVTFEITKNMSNVIDGPYCSDLNGAGPYALDVANDRFYWLLFTVGDNVSCSQFANDSYPLEGHIVGMDITTGDVETNPVVCDFFEGDCPWDFEIWTGSDYVSL